MHTVSTVDGKKKTYEDPKKGAKMTTLKENKKIFFKEKPKNRNKYLKSNDFPAF
jgi:hypothetical protein